LATCGGGDHRPVIATLAGLVDRHEIQEIKSERAAILVQKAGQIGGGCACHLIKPQRARKACDLRSGAGQQALQILISDTQIACHIGDEQVVIIGRPAIDRHQQQERHQHRQWQECEDQQS